MMFRKGVLKRRLTVAAAGLALVVLRVPGFSQISYEAENAVLGGKANVSTEHAGFSGTGYVQGYDAGFFGASTTFSVTADAAGYYDVVLRYGNGYDASSISVYVNSVKQIVSALPTTGSWTAWSSKSETLFLNGGSNRIAYVFDTGDGGRINLDKISVGPTASIKPDLSADDILWTPAAPQEGDTIRFSAIVKNSGNGPTPSTAYKVSFRIDNAEVCTSAPYSAPIAANGSATITAAAVWSGSHGTYSASAVVDPDNAVAEFSKTNNTKSKPLTILQKSGPDLTVQSVNWTPANPAVGNTVTFSVLVKNQGLDPTPASGVSARVTVNGTLALNGSIASAIAPGASAAIGISGSWTAVNGASTIVAAADPQNAIAESFEGNNTMSQKLFVGRGAQVPWVEYEAEDGVCAGGAKVVGPSRALGTPAGEASGRKAVMLDQANASIEWAAIAPANSIVIRACIPDAPGGGGIQAPISLYVNDVHKADIPLTSEHSWVYGDYGMQTDNPSAGQARKIYDESHLLFSGFSINTGDKVMLRKDAADNAAYYAIDFVDLEQVGAPVSMPAGYISITDAKQNWTPAKPDDDLSDDYAINQCIMAVQAGKFAGVYLPPGTFVQTNKYIATHVKIQGAGMWYTTLYCPDKSEDAGWGQTGFNVNGDSCEFRDFAIFGWGGVRGQGGKAWVNSAHKNTVIERMWVEHVQCGYWVGGNQESTNLHVKDCRFRNTGADGINLCNGNLNGLVENCHNRGNGDDAFAIWSATDLYPHPCINNVIRNCTAALPWRAACFAIYGGRGNRIENCVGADALTYPGLTVSSEFTPYPMDSATVDGLTLYRCGATYWDPNQQFGAVWLFSAEQTFANVTIKNVDIVDPTFQGIHIQSSKGSAPGFPIQNTRFENITISNPTTFGVQIKAGSLGGATFKNVTMASNINNVPRLVNQATGFTVTELAVSAIPAVNPASSMATKVSCSGSRVVIDFAEASAAIKSPVTIALFTANGKRVVFLSRLFDAGEHRLALDKTSMGKSSGLYIVSIEHAGKKQRFPITFK